MKQLDFYELVKAAKNNFCISQIYVIDYDNDGEVFCYND